MLHEHCRQIEELEIFVGALEQVVVDLGQLLENDGLFGVCDVGALHEHVVQLKNDLVAAEAVEDELLEA